MNESPKPLAVVRRVIGHALAWLLIWLAGAGLAVWLGSSFAAVAVAVVGGWILFCAFTLYFFRDPTPRVPLDPSAVVAPAHGRVDFVGPHVESDVMGGECQRISIFLSIFDVHVQNAPVAGKIVFLKHQPGRFLSALKTLSAQCNENALIGIQPGETSDERIAVRQIAGLIARRVVSWVAVGDVVARGQRLGLIHYGSRCDLYLPPDYQVLVRCGDRVKGGETISANRRQMLPSSPASSTVEQKESSSDARNCDCSLDQRTSPSPSSTRRVCTRWPQWSWR